MGKRSKMITTATLLIFCILFISVTVYIKSGTSKKNSENEIYPKGDISNSKVFDSSHNKKAVSLNKEDAKYILQTVKDSKKDLVTEYEGGLVELNISFTDSVIQLVRKDDETIYYVFHNNKINGICYKINSKNLSKFILKISTQ
ncbi:hypothetical protein [Clostridium manihotivorum]|uniref:Uncharacterized protein n=1 Tax=Clostridium manihotivorum TaxID=2320868 RepID=A0A410DT25_9CLOT|nr:hypothetical protein [Clostridium manihotivorum]QAA32132.1 hypothetical protein C1I91_10970 [Clostridium manihotivorum]